MERGVFSATETTADVVVLGAGPAGCATAIRCAQAGCRVVLLDAAAFPRHRPGETLHPGVMVLLQQLGVAAMVEAAGFGRHLGQMVAWGTAPQFQAFGETAGVPWRGLQAPRDRFDTILRDHAASLGVTVWQPCRAQSVLLDKGRVIGVVTTSGVVRAAYTVDATGGGHWLARQLATPPQRVSRRLLAYYGYQPSDAATQPSLNATPDGWTWEAPLGNGTTAWVWLPFRTNAQRPTNRGSVRGADVTWRWLPQPTGPGYYIVGDAAGVLDPVSSHGVLRALLAGIQAAHCITSLQHKGFPEPHAQQHYQAWWHGLFTHEIAQMNRLYAQLPAAWGVTLTPHRASLTVATGATQWPKQSSSTFAKTASSR